VRDGGAAELTRVRKDPTAFLANQLRQGGSLHLGDGRVVVKLPFRLFWIWDGAFCGAINLRFRRGTEDLPAHVSGHVGYAVVPWKGGMGYGKRAFALLLPFAAADGLARVLVTSDENNVASRKVIRANGGVLTGRVAAPDDPEKYQLRFWVPTRRPGSRAPNANSA
jgi:predicted acetyltransferase